jgi:hypothetical protein
MPPVASTPEGSNPQGEEQVIGQEKIVVGDVVGLMRSFQRMSEALINQLDRDEARAPVPNEGSQRTPAGSGSIHRELEKVKFPEFMGATTTQPLRHGWRTWRCALHFMTTPPT